MRLIVISTIVVVIIGVLTLASSVVWLPDVLSRKLVVVGSYSLPENQIIKLTQTWAGDGYLTMVSHKLLSGETIVAVGDPDLAGKIWQMRTECDTNTTTLTFHFLSRKWRYNYQTRFLDVEDSSGMVIRQDKATPL